MILTEGRDFSRGLVENLSTTSGNILEQGQWEPNIFAKGRLLNLAAHRRLTTSCSKRVANVNSSICGKTSR
jgi:hypothetical protein